MTRKERTVVILKPDAVQRGIMGEVLHRLERKGFKVVGMKFMYLDKEVLTEHYAHHKDKPFFGKLLDFMMSTPSLAVVFEGKNVVAAVRTMTGSTNAAEAIPGTLRGDFALSIQQNVVHVSEDTEQAEAEVKRFFKPDELFDYDRADMAMIYAADERE